jgi:hypothetical protein
MIALLLTGAVALADNTGVPPLARGDFATIHQGWLSGLSGGQNQLTQSLIVAHAGGGQAQATPLIPGNALYQVDLVANAGDSVALPNARPPFQFALVNNGANSLNVFASSADFINGTAGSTPFAVASMTSAVFTCVERGRWAAMTGGGGGATVPGGSSGQVRRAT